MSDKITLFGKLYDAVGSPLSNTLIRTKGDLKIQWGNKFIDLIKDGKIASSGETILKLVASEEEITTDGIYIVGEELVWINIGGHKLNITEHTKTTYISFLEPQELDPELKYLTLRNIGFLYETLKEAKAAGLQSGIIYVLESQKLYIIKDGNIQEYLVLSTKLENTESKKDSEEGENSENTEIPETSNVFDDIIIGDLHIYNDSGQSKFNSSSKIQLLLNNTAYISLADNNINVYKHLVLNPDIYILSQDASLTEGFRLYTLENQSYLEIDNNLPILRLNKSIIYSNISNIITLVTTDDIIEEDTGENTELVNPIDDTSYNDTITLNLYLKYKNQFELNLWVYLYPKSLIIVKLETIDSGVSVTLDLEMICEEDITIRVYYDTESESELEPASESDKTVDITLPAYNTEIYHLFEYTGINTYTIVSAPDNVITDYQLPVKRDPLEYCITESYDNYIVIQVPRYMYKTILNTGLDSIILISRDPFIKLENNNLSILDRSKTIITDVLTDEGVIRQEIPDITEHTKIGMIKESDFKNLTEYPTNESDILNLKEYESNIEVGIYSDHFIGLNSILYNPIFKNRGDNQYPKYDDSLKCPETELLDEKYDLVIPNLSWIKQLLTNNTTYINQLLSSLIPSGIIVMWHGSVIPNGWVVCNGSNNTPDLRNKFIRGSAGSNEEGSIKINSNLDSNSDNLNYYSLIFIMKK